MKRTIRIRARGNIVWECVPVHWVEGKNNGTATLAVQFIPVISEELSIRTHTCDGEEAQEKRRRG